MGLWLKRECSSCGHRLQHRRGRRHCETCGAKLRRRWHWRTSLAVFAAVIVITGITAGRQNVAFQAQIVGSWRIDDGRFAGTTVEFTSAGLLVYVDQSRIVSTGTYVI